LPPPWGGIISSPSGEILCCRNTEGVLLGHWDAPEISIGWEFDSYHTGEIAFVGQIGDILCSREGLLYNRSSIVSSFHDTIKGHLHKIANEARLAVLGSRHSDIEAALVSGNEEREALSLRLVSITRARLCSAHKNNDLDLVSNLRSYLYRLSHDATQIPRAAFEEVQDVLLSELPISLGALPGTDFSLSGRLQPDGEVEIFWLHDRVERRLGFHYSLDTWKLRPSDIASASEKEIKSLIDRSKKAQKITAPIREPLPKPVAEDKEPFAFVTKFDDGSYASFIANSRDSGCHGAISSTGFYSATLSGDIKLGLENKRADFLKEVATAKKAAPILKQTVALFDKALFKTYQNIIITLAGRLQKPEDSYVLYHAIHTAHSDRLAWEASVEIRVIKFGDVDTVKESLFNLWTKLVGVHSPNEHSQGLRFFAYRRLFKLAQNITLTGDIQGHPYELKFCVGRETTWQEKSNNEKPPLFGVRCLVGEIRIDGESQTHNFQHHWYDSTKLKDIAQSCGLEYAEPVSETPTSPKIEQNEFAFA